MAIVKIQGEHDLKTGVHYEVDFDQPPIGYGGMGTVMQGVRVDKNGVRADVAIKFLYEDLSATAIDRARREASIQLGHDNLVKMYGFIEMNDGETQRYHVVSELLHGIMLHDFIRGEILQNEYFKNQYSIYSSDKGKYAVCVIKQILSGLMALHDYGYIHRDIDPSNIMMTEDGKIKLIDFGVASKISTVTRNARRLTSDGNFIGKAGYAAPELAFGDIEHQNATTDIYAIGILFYQLITGELPFEGSIHEVLEMQKNMPLPIDNIENVQIRRIIEKATMKNQQLRYKTVAEFRVALDNIQWEEAVDKGLNSNSSKYVRRYKNFHDDNGTIEVGSVDLGKANHLVNQKDTVDTDMKEISKAKKNWYEKHVASSKMENLIRNNNVLAIMSVVVGLIIGTILYYVIN